MILIVVTSFFISLIYNGSDHNDENDDSGNGNHVNNCHEIDDDIGDNYDDYW